MISHIPCNSVITENEPLDVHGTQQAFEMLTKEINEHSDAMAAIANANANAVIPPVTSPTTNTTVTTTNKDAMITAKHYTVDEVAYGFIRVANEAMARPIRNLTTMKGRVLPFLIRFILPCAPCPLSYYSVPSSTLLHPPLHTHPTLYPNLPYSTPQR